jgi:hypothetical protein
MILLPDLHPSSFILHPLTDPRPLLLLARFCLSPVTCHLQPMICPRCNKRPAKRACPALATKICAVCCAQDRMIELACPESCRYLRDGRDQVAERERQIRSKAMEAAGKMGTSIDEQMMGLIYTIEQAVINLQRGTTGGAIGDMEDTEVLAALEITIKNVETEDAGLIYEHHASSPRVQEISRAIRKAFDDLSEKIIPENRPTRAQIVKALGLERDAVEAHLRLAPREPRSRTYLRNTSIFFPWPEPETKPLIITG